MLSPEWPGAYLFWKISHLLRTEGINNRIKRGKQAILGNFALLCECSRAPAHEPERKKMADPPLINNRTEWSRDWAENLSFSFTLSLPLSYSLLGTFFLSVSCSLLLLSEGWVDRWSGVGTGNGFYAQSEIYGGRYARAKIILISERKGKEGKFRRLTGPTALGRGYQV